MDAVYSLFCLPSRKYAPKQSLLSIDDACACVSSGDILLVSGTSYSSHFVTYFCAAQWSHVAIVYRDEHGVPYLFEAIKNDDEGSKNVDVITGRHAVGVRLIDMRKFLKSFTGNAIALRMLMTPTALGISRLLREHITDRLSDMVVDYDGIPYEHRPIDFVLARHRLVQQTSMTLDSMFCSKLVAWCYINVGLLSTDKVCANQFLPDDFSETGSIEFSYPTYLPFPGLIDETSRPPIKLGGEMYIALAGTPEAYAKFEGPSSSLEHKLFPLSHERYMAPTPTPASPMTFLTDSSSSHRYNIR